MKIFDFFDEIFPLSKKQEREAKKREEEAKLKELSTPLNAFEDEISVDEELNSEAVEVTEVFEDEDDKIAVFGGIETKIEEAEEDDEAEEIFEYDDIDDALELDALDEDEEVLAEMEALDEAPEEDDLDALLREELIYLSEKLDNMERAVDTMEFSENENAKDNEFSYEYNEEFFDEEETPAFKHPELKRRHVPVRKKKSNKNPYNIDSKTAMRVGAAVIAALATYKLINPGKDE